MTCFTLGWFLFPFTLTESSQSSCKFYSAGKQRVREVLITYPNLRRNFKSILAWAPNTTSTSKLSWLKKNFKISRRCQKWQGLEITAAFPLYKSNNNEREKKICFKHLYWLFSGSLGIRYLGLKIFVISCVNYALLLIQNGNFGKCRKPWRRE